jgi:hypothetical protein
MTASKPIYYLRSYGLAHRIVTIAQNYPMSQRASVNDRCVVSSHGGRRSDF